jgi:TolB-like protein/DNA-binding winged helix-turn-helix (wHTH) protein/tetratricopeptide (TPR) repeat protein
MAMRDVPRSGDNAGAKIQQSMGAVRFAGLILDLDACSLVRDSGETIPLTRGEFALLRVFVTRPARVLSRDALLAEVANRNHGPFDRSVDVLVGRLRRKIEPVPKAPTLIVTVPGQGYRFDGQKARSAQAEVEHAEWTPDNAQADGSLSEGPSRLLLTTKIGGSIGRTRFTHTFALLVAVFALIAAGTYGWNAGLLPLTARNENKPAPRLSIVVLPFENLSGEPEQDHFADGLTDDLTTDLSHLDGSFVIGRGTAFAYKGRPVDAVQIGRDLAVRYALEGSVKRVGDKIAVNARLVSTDSAAQVWADRFDGDRARSSELQFEFVSRLVNSLGDELIKAEALRVARERPNNPDAADLTVRGWAMANLTDSRDRFDEAINLFERALSLDPHNVPAMTGLAVVLMWHAYDGWSDDWDRDMSRAEEIVNRALMIEPTSSILHNARASLLGNKRQWQAAIAENETAIAYDRNNALAYAIAGLHKAYVGRGDEGIAYLETALRLNPRDGSVPNWQYFICHIHNLLGRWEKAIEWCNKSIVGNPELTYPLFGLATAHAWAGHEAEAKDAVARILKAIPGFTMQKVWQADKFSDDPIFKAQYTRAVDGLRRAGLPEN